MQTTYMQADGTEVRVQYCTHFFCLAPARAYSRRKAVARVTYSGITLLVCSDDMVPLMQMIHSQGLEHTVETI